jgi:type IV pilus assembly protein PilM
VAQADEIIINCGNSHVSANVFASTAEGLLLKSSGLETLHHDLTKEDAWLDSLVLGLEKLCEKMSLKGEVRFIFPGNLLLTKTIRVPHVDPEKQRKIVAFELSQKMPFPLSDLIWDYQIIDDDGVEEEVLAFAVKPEMAENFSEKMVSLGLIPKQITPAQVLDYNAIRGVLGDSDDHSEVLAINVGAKSTNLLFINPTGFLIRTITIGGNALSQNISDALGITFEKAEKLKKGYFSQEISLTEDDPSISVIQNASNQFLARASQEITRSIVTYKRLKKGKSPQKIFLTGRGALLPNLAQHLIDSQQLQVQYFDPLSSVIIGNGIKEKIKPLLPFMTSEAMGLARSLFNLNSTGTAGFASTINLLPSSKIKSLGLKQKLPFISIAVFVLSLLPLPSIIKHYNQQAEIKVNQRKLNNELSLLDEEISQQKETHKELLFSQNFISELKNSQAALQGKIAGSWAIQDIINYIQGIITDDEIGDIWLDSFSLAKPKDKAYELVKGISSRNFILTISGRYLVRIDKKLKDDEKRDQLIELDRTKKEKLTAYFSDIPFIKKIKRKSFSIEGKGDLFNRFFSHYEYEIVLDLL